MRSMVFVGQWDQHRPRVHCVQVTEVVELGASDKATGERLEFDWGNQSVEAGRLAYTILLHIFGRHPELPGAAAAFLRDVVSRLPYVWAIRDVDVWDWLLTRYEGQQRSHPSAN